MGKCALCGLDKVPYEDQFNRDAYHIQCPHCGDYVVTEEAFRYFEVPQGFVKDHLHLLSAVARHSWDRKDLLHIDTRLLEDRSEFEARVLSQCPRGVQEKVDAVLRLIAEKSDHPGSNIPLQGIATDYVHLYCKDDQEVRLYVEHLHQQHLLDRVGLSEVKVAVGGWARLEQLERPNIDSKQAFVAMWFDGKLDTLYTQGIAGIEQDTGFKPLRIDMKQFNEKICDHIVAEIRRSRFLIADVTGHRQGVYFEAGFAMGLGLPIIWTCRKDQIDKCHFDTRQYNHITWETPEELREKLKDRILATIGSPH